MMTTKTTQEHHNDGDDSKGLERQLYSDSEDGIILLPNQTQWMAKEPFGFEAAIDDTLGFIYYLDHLRCETHAHLAARHTRPSWRHQRGSMHPRTSDDPIRRTSSFTTQQVYEVELSASEGSSLLEKFGFDTTGDKQCFVSNIVADSPLARSSVPLGSELVQINNTDVSHFSSADIRTMLLQCRGATSLSLVSRSRTRRRTFDKSSSLRIFLADGRYKTLFFWPNSTVRDIIEELCEKLDIACQNCFELMLQEKSGDRVVLPRCFSIQHLADLLAEHDSLQCAFRFRYIPKTPDRLMRHDVKAFVLLFEQCSRDVVSAHLPFIANDTLLRLGALSIFLWSFLQGKHKVDLQAIGKSIGFEQFIPAHVVANTRGRDLRKVLRTNMKNVEVVLQQSKVTEQQVPNTLRMFYLKLVCNEQSVVTHYHDAFMMGSSGKVAISFEDGLTFMQPEAERPLVLGKLADVRSLTLARNSSSPVYAERESSRGNVFRSDTSAHPPLMLADLHRFRCKHIGMRSSSQSGVTSTEYALTIRLDADPRDVTFQVISSVSTICALVQSILGFYNAHFPASMTRLLKDEAHAYGLRPYFATHTVFTTPWNYGVDFLTRVEERLPVRVQFNPEWFGVRPQPSKHLHCTTAAYSSTNTNNTNNGSGSSGGRVPATGGAEPTSHLEGEGRSTASTHRDTQSHTKTRVKPRVIRVSSSASASDVTTTTTTTMATTPTTPAASAALASTGKGSNASTTRACAVRHTRSDSAVQRMRDAHVTRLSEHSSHGEEDGDTGGDANRREERHGGSGGDGDMARTASGEVTALSAAIKQAGAACVQLENALNPAGPQSGGVASWTYADAKTDLWLSLQQLASSSCAYVHHVKQGNCLPVQSATEVVASLEAFADAAATFFDISPDTATCDQCAIGEACVAVSQATQMLLQANAHIRPHASSCATHLLAFISAGLQQMQHLHALAMLLHGSHTVSIA
ncbi:hypothetical protein PTSG_04002 [Salpingoeca rosetta]|uniref:FERM domain-containing protein n=1 Tax=Salpingoeca rosetta (strain ATCC 50818 / BSB-021) TaxID=946362 RepID=F2U7H8_SALR5|nr:uncharacterized protein PTSG_04002 [Salpingoeca rosetta]EGD83395.1 hypothetical protein PTSG_04002 [Salpingoeca rosetta]|eukprot:XP_004994899.1 hypothetical protein PTSG_04002 [Salpingoeca rosetta]